MSTATESPRHFTKKPVSISAMRYTESFPSNLITWINVQGGQCEWRCREVTGDDTKLCLPDAGHDLIIHTLEGEMLVGEGDWVIRGVQNEFYPCKDDIFRATYDGVFD